MYVLKIWVRLGASQLIYGEIVDELSYCQLSKRDCAPCSYTVTWISRIRKERLFSWHLQSWRLFPAPPCCPQEVILTQRSGCHGAWQTRDESWFEAERRHTATPVLLRKTPCALNYPSYLSYTRTMGSNSQHFFISRPIVTHPEPSELKDRRV